MIKHGETMDSRWGGGKNWTQEDFEKFLRYILKKYAKDMKNSGAPEDYEIMVGVELRYVGQSRG